MQQSTFSNWIKAIRPKTLAASASPVILGSAIAFSDNGFKWKAALLCLGVAVLAQISSNLVNDYYDFKNGMDKKERSGPERMVASGKISPKNILTAACIFLAGACLCGLGLLFFADWRIIFVGILIAVCVFFYSAGPFPLSHHALGDIAVFIFYGIIPVCFTYFVQTNMISLICLVYSVAIGLLSANILIVNNYRDVKEDRESGKITTIVLFGRKAGLITYLLNIIIASSITIIFDFQWIKLPIFIGFALLCLITWFDLKRKNGSKLNAVLAATSRNVLIFALLCTISLVFGMYS